MITSVFSIEVLLKNSIHSVHNFVSVDSIIVFGQDQGLASSFGYINVSSSSLYITAAMPVDARGYICQGQSHLLTVNESVYVNCQCHCVPI